MQFLLTNLLLIAVGTMLYLVVRTLPRLEEEAGDPDKRTVFERIVMSDIPHKLDSIINTFLGKMFRKAKIQLMRLDNYLTKKLKVLHAGNGNRNGKNGTNAEFIEELKGPIEEAVGGE